MSRLIGLRHIALLDMQYGCGNGIGAKAWERFIELTADIQRLGAPVITKTCKTCNDAKDINYFQPSQWKLVKGECRACSQIRRGSSGKRKAGMEWGQSFCLSEKSALQRRIL